MKQIAKDFALTGYSNLQKEPLFKFLFNHMLTVQDCGVCGGDCDPLTHKFPAIEAPPTGARKSPSPSPKQTRHGKKPANTSPTSLVTQHDNSKDKPVGDDTTTENNQLYVGQPGAGQSTSSSPSPHLDKSPRIPLRERIATGGRTFQPDEMLQDLQAHQKRVQSELDKAAREEEERREQELIDLDNSDSDTDLSDDADDFDTRAAEETKKLEDAAAAIHRQKEIAHAKKVQEKKDAKAAAKAAKAADRAKRQRAPAPVTLRVPRGPVKKTPVNNKTPAKKGSKRAVTIDLEEVVIPDPDDEDDDGDDDVFKGSISPRSLVNYMADSMAKALDKRERASRGSVPVNSADPHNINSVPHGAPNTGRVALRSVPNTAMADRIGVAPPPTMVLEGDQTSLDVHKLTKHMKSGSKRTVGEFVQRQAIWPEQLLAPTAPNHGKLDHDVLSFPELMDGLLGKIMVETSPLNTEVANKLSYMREIVSMHYNLELKDVLSINKRFFLAWENKSFEWDDWPRIEMFLRDAKYQQLITSFAYNTRRNSAPPKQGGQPTKPTGESFVDGVPSDFLRTNKVCIRFNKGTCDIKNVTQHEHPFDKKKVVYHHCGACKKAGKVDESHGSSEKDKCSNKQPFRK